MAKKVICDTDVMIDYWDTLNFIIAATAIIADLELFTNNTKDLNS
jgi:hypothetical protein